MADAEQVEREVRQLRLMVDRLDRFKRQELAIGPVIADLEALLNQLELASEEWHDASISGWSNLEIPYAVALDRLEPIPTIDDETVAEGVDLLARLVREQLDALSTWLSIGSGYAGNRGNWP